MSAPGEDVIEAAAYIESRVGTSPDVAIVLGSGLGAVVNAMDLSVAVAYAEIPHWPTSEVAGHDNRLMTATLGSRPVLGLAGRAHFYEGHQPAAVAFPTRVLARLGVRTLILTNAAGGIREDLAPGDLLVIEDHLNLMGMNPLRGPQTSHTGPRFPDMSEVYSRRLRDVVAVAARDLGVAAAHGVYAAVAGPCYETPAEIRFLRTAGADAVGMSTVPEAIVARQLGLDVAAISCISNRAAGLASAPLEHGDVLAVTARTAERLARLLTAVVQRL